MKKLFIIILSLTVVLSNFTFSFADNKSTDIIINGQPVQFTDQTGYPFIDSANRTQVPLRAAMEAYGCTVSWDQKTKTATIEKDGINVTVPVGENYIYRNGNQVANDTASVIIDNKTYLPIRVVLESVGANVGWDGKNVVVGSGKNLKPIYYDKYPTLLSIENIAPDLTMKYGFVSDIESMDHYAYVYMYKATSMKQAIADAESYSNYLKNMPGYMLVQRIDNGKTDTVGDFEYAFYTPDMNYNIGINCKYSYNEETKQVDNFVNIEIKHVYGKNGNSLSNYPIQTPTKYQTETTDFGKMFKIHPEKISGESFYYAYSNVNKEMSDVTDYITNLIGKGFVSKPSYDDGNGNTVLVYQNPYLNEYFNHFYTTVQIETSNGKRYIVVTLHDSYPQGKIPINQSSPNLNSGTPYYSGFQGAPDFGALYNTTPIQNAGNSYFYLISDFNSECITDYVDVLSDCGFEFLDSMQGVKEWDSNVLTFINYNLGMSVSFGTIVNNYDFENAALQVMVKRL